MMYEKFSSGMKIYKDTVNDGDIILKVTKVLPVFPDGWRPVMIINGEQFAGVGSTQTDGGILGT
jgi:hypothetical protein